MTSYAPRNPLQNCAESRDKVYTVLHMASAQEMLVFMGFNELSTNISMSPSERYIICERGGSQIVIKVTFSKKKKVTFSPEFFFFNISSNWFCLKEICFPLFTDSAESLGE